MSPLATPIPPSASAQGRVTESEAQAMLRAVLNLLDKWDLQTKEKLVLLGCPSERTFRRWRVGQIGRLSSDTVFRLGDLLAIHAALRRRRGAPPATARAVAPCSPM